MHPALSDDFVDDVVLFLDFLLLLKRVSYKTITARFTSTKTVATYLDLWSPLVDDFTHNDGTTHSSKAQSQITVIKQFCEQHSETVDVGFFVIPIVVVEES